MSLPILISLGGALLLLCLLSAAVSAIETALLCLKEQHVTSLAGKDPALLEAIRRFSRDPQRQLNNVILVGSVVHLAIASIVLLYIETGPIPGDLSPLAAGCIALAVIVTLIEVFPTLIAVARPDAVFRYTAGPLCRINPFLGPVASCFVRLTDRATAALIPDSLQPRSSLTEEELETLIELRREEGTLHLGESEMIQEILKLGNKTAKDCMTPRVDAVVISGDLPDDEAASFIRTQPHWHVPVYRDSPDSIVGTLDVREFLLSGEADYRKFIRPPVFVPETMKALDVFEDFLKAPHRLAIVLDEFGGLEGVLSQTDLIEEIIGDTAPQNDQFLEIQDLGKNRLLVAGSARLDEIGEILGVDLEMDGLDTIAGLLFTEGDRLPQPGDRIGLDGVVATIRKCSARRIEEVLLEKTRASGPGPSLDPAPRPPASSPSSTDAAAS